MRDDAEPVGRGGGIDIPEALAVSDDRRTLVDEAGLERELAAVRATAAGPLAGIFGPASMMWRVDREAAVFLGAGRAILLQLAHPWVASAIAEHSRTLADPIGRFHRTFGVVFTMVFGTVDQAIAAARRLHRRHVGIQGRLTETAGRFPAGSAYRANDIPALSWVHASLVETAVLAHDLVLPPLAPEDRERYYRESLRFAGLFGIPGASLPQDWTAFAGYIDAMCRSDVLTVSATARAVAGEIFRGAGAGLRIPSWYLALTARMLPSGMRDAFGLAYGRQEQRAAERALAWLRGIYRFLPAPLRYVGPYHEAQDRLSGRPPKRGTALLNRFWIGRRSMGG
jgi:uncharacterized protein (DUF2236 family)